MSRTYTRRNEWDTAYKATTTGPGGVEVELIMSDLHGGDVCGGLPHPATGSHGAAYRNASFGFAQEPDVAPSALIQGF